MTDLEILRSAMARAGLLLPAALVTDGNRKQQTQELKNLAALAALARAVDEGFALDDSLDEEALYQALNRAFSLEIRGIHSLEELQTRFTEARRERLRATRPPPFPMPRYSLEGEDPDALDRAEAERYAIDSDVLEQPLSPERRAAYSELIEDACASAAQETPWKVGTTRADHAEPFPIGMPPDDRDVGPVPPPPPSPEE